MCQDCCTFPLVFSFKGKIETVQISTETSEAALFLLAATTTGIVDVNTLKLLYKGKRLNPSSEAVFLSKVPTKPPKIMVLATASAVIQDVTTRKADPTIRGLEQEIARDDQRKSAAQLPYPLVWGKHTKQHKNYKFVKFEPCERIDFGEASHKKSPPHPFQAKSLLHQLATDPGVCAVMKSRELVVNCLGEMDPIDDRLMQKQQSQQPGSCLLGYNTNHGLRIDIKLRSDDLSDFRPYPQLVQTLLHELSHNWVGEHNLLFWTNYGNLRLEYLYAHYFHFANEFINGKTTSQIAGLPATGGGSRPSVDRIYDMVIQELVHDMRQHGLHPQMIANALKQTCNQLQVEHQQASPPKTLGSGDNSDKNDDKSRKSARQLALEAAEKRRQGDKEAE